MARNQIIFCDNSLHINGRLHGIVSAKGLPSPPPLVIEHLPLSPLPLPLLFPCTSVFVCDTY